MIALAAHLALGISLHAGPSGSRLKVPEGFVAELVAGEPQVVFPMFAAFDERGRLFVAESSGLDLYAEITAATRKCRVKMLADRDGDGRFEIATVFADRLVFPMGLVWHDGKLYVADPPDLVALEDTDGDDRADRRSVVLTGFGHTDNGSLHGLTIGPDGWLYMTMGSPDGYRLKRDDGTFLEGRSGALIRCRPDGTGVEVVCRGFVNLIEVVFTAGGEIIGTDNWFQQPSGGVRDALVHLVEGGLYPYEPDVGTPQPVTGRWLPPVSLFPAVALSGLARYRGDLFPAGMRGNLFSAQHNTRKVGRHALLRDGTTFRTENVDFVTSEDPDFHPSDVLEDADGSLLVVDTGGWYVQHCPTGRIRDSRAPGGIHRIRYSRGPPVEDPWGLNLDWTSASEQQLIDRLGDSRTAVQDRASRYLVERGQSAIAPLAAALTRSSGREAKQRALWVLCRIADESALKPVRQMLRDSDNDLVATAARVLARRDDRKASADLCRRLDGPYDGAQSAREPPRPPLTLPSPLHGRGEGGPDSIGNEGSARGSDQASYSSVRMAAAEALARCGDARALDSIWRALTNQVDRFLEHALVYAAHRVADEEALEAALQHAHPRVQSATLLLLDQRPRSRDALGFDDVSQRVSSSDAELRRTALQIWQKRSGWSRQSAQWVGKWLERPSPSGDEMAAVSDLILAFQNEAAVQELVGSRLVAPDTLDALRLRLLGVISQSTLSPLPASWIAGLKRSLENPGTRMEAVRTAARLQETALDERLLQLAEEKSEPAPLRVEALRGVIGRKPKLSDSLFDFMLGQMGCTTNPAARLAAVDVLRRAHLTDAQFSRVLSIILGDALVSPGTLAPAFREVTSPENAKQVVASLIQAIQEGWRAAESDLDGVLRRLPVEAQLEAGALRELARKNETGAAKLKQYEPLLTAGDAERGRTVFFGPKVACSTCHAIGEAGGKVGPDLTKVGAVRSGRDILESILLPNASFAQGYDNYRGVIKDGEEISGVIAGQSPEAIILRGASGAERQVPRDQIQELTRSEISLMPEGLEQGMTAQEFSDLLAFLQGLK